MKGRKYKNGITGLRYKKLYIVDNGGKNNFQVIDEEGNILLENIENSSEAKWEIDKLVADELEKKLINQLYDMELYRLSDVFFDLMIKASRKELSAEEEEIYYLVDIVRKRRAKHKPL